MWISNIRHTQPQSLCLCRSLLTVARVLCRLCLATNNLLIPHWQGDDLYYLMGLFHPWLLWEPPQWLVTAHGVECCFQCCQPSPGTRVLHALVWRSCWYPPLINVISSGWRQTYKSLALKAPEAGQDKSSRIRWMTLKSLPSLLSDQSCWIYEITVLISSCRWMFSLKQVLGSGSRLPDKEYRSGWLN